MPIHNTVKVYKKKLAKMPALLIKPFDVFLTINAAYAAFKGFMFLL